MKNIFKVLSLYICNHQQLSRVNNNYTIGTSGLHDTHTWSQGQQVWGLRMYIFENHKCTWYNYHVTLSCINCVWVSATLAIQISYINIVPLHVYIVAYCIQFWICNIANVHTTYVHCSMCSWFWNYDWGVLLCA